MSKGLVSPIYPQGGVTRGWTANKRDYHQRGPTLESVKHPLHNKVIADLYAIEKGDKAVFDADERSIQAFSGAIYLLNKKLGKEEFFLVVTKRGEKDRTQKVHVKMLNRRKKAFVKGGHIAEFTVYRLS